jgi:hypothetical protein
MNYKNPLILLFAFVVGLLLSRMTFDRLPPAGAQSSAQETAFVYQGRLLERGTVVNATCDFQFGLYSQATDGTALGTVTLTGVSVTEGYFTAELDFGDLFDGGARYLEVSVLCPDDAEYVLMGERVSLAPVPYAIYANRAGHATTVLTATTATTAITVTNADNATSASQVSWNEILGIPGGLADKSDSDQLSTMSCPTGQVVKASGNSWVCADDNDTNTLEELIAAGTSCDTGSGDTMMKWNGTEWECQEDIDTNTTYSAMASGGITLTNSNQFGLETGYQLPQSCTDKQLSKWNNTLQKWECRNDNYLGGTAAGGDLTGTYPNPTLNSLQGYTLAITTTPLKGDFLSWDGSQWTPSSYSSSAGGDLDGDFPNPEVVGIYGDPIANTAPSDNNLLIYSGGTWTAGDLAVGGDLDGSLPAPEVDGLRSKSVPNPTSTTGGQFIYGDLAGWYLTDAPGATPNQFLVWDGITWAPSTFATGGDLSGDLGSATVVGLRGYDIATTAPSANGQLLQWDNPNSQWEPTTATAASATGQILQWNNSTTQWRPASGTAPSSSLQLLYWNGSQWTPTSFSIEVEYGAQSDEARAVCDVGDIVIGGGCSNPSNIALEESTPFEDKISGVDRVGWYCNIKSGSTTDRAYAICLDPGDATIGGNWDDGNWFYENRSQYPP